MLCKNCGKENKNTNIRCEFCNYEIIETNEISERKNITFHQKIIIMIVILIFGYKLVEGLLLIGSVVYSYLLEYNQKKDYDKTVASLTDYVNCEYEEGTEICNAIYEYKVDDVIYTISSDFLADKNAFRTLETVYYNPSVPSEAVIYNDTEKNTLTIVGIIFGLLEVSFMSVGLLIFSFVLKNPKKIT